MAEENISQDFRLKNTGKTKKYFVEEIEQNELMSKKQNNLNYIGQFFIFVYAVTTCISISAFASLLGIPIGITSSTIGSKFCAITAGTKRYKSTIKKMKKKQKKVLLAKIKLSSIEVLISKALIDS